MADNLKNVLDKMIDTDTAIINKLKAKVTSFASDISTLKTNVSTLQTNMKTAQSDISTLKTNVSTLQTNMKTAQSDISNLKTNVNTLNTTLSKTTTEFKDSLAEVEEKVKKGGSTYSIVDINSSGITGSGSLVTDTGASYGKSYQATGSSSSVCVYSCKFSAVNFGYYSICARVKSSSTSSSNVVQLRILNGSTEIMSQNFTGKSFSSTSAYDYIYSTFNYELKGTTKQDLTFQIYVLSNGVKINFDYAYISMTMPSVFV